MAYVGRNFSPADIGENEIYGFDFANQLGPGEVITSSTWQCSNSDVLQPLGPSAVDGAIVSQRLLALSRGAVVLACFVETSCGNRLHLSSRASVQVSAT